MREFFPDPAICPVDNVCEFNGAPGVPCGSEPGHVWALLPAERVCLYALINRVDAYDSGTSYANEQQKMTSAAIELGLGSRDDNVAAICFDSARARYAAMQASEVPGSERWIAASQGKVYLPAFRERRSAGTVSADTIAEVYKGLGELGRTLVTHEGFQAYGRVVPDFQLRGGLGEVMVPNLLLRLNDPNFFPWLASQREDVGTRDLAAFNHDSYLLRSYGKLPMQLKYGRIHKQRRDVYDPRILQLSFRGIAGETSLAIQNRDRTKEQPPIQFVELLMAHMIIREAAGEETYSDERKVLDIASSIVVQKVLAHEREMFAGST